MRRAISLFITMAIALSTFAQAPVVTEKRFWDDPVNNPMLPIYLVTSFVFFVIILVGFVAIYLMKVLNMLTEQAEKEHAQKLGVAYVPKPSWWQRVVERVNAAVPVEEEKSIELDHDYDGIKELDNHLPPWWKWLFYGTIGFAAVYLVAYNLTATLPSQEEEYQHELAVAEDQARKFKASQPQAEIDESKLAFSNDQTIIEKGKAVFMDNNCGSCHRPDGGGNTIGPNLTDEYWLHGGDIKQIFTTVKNGVVEKGMPAWGKSLSPEKVRDVTFFVLSLQGSNPANAKGPQGEIFKQAPVSSDSVKVQASL